MTRLLALPLALSMPVACASTPVTPRPMLDPEAAAFALQEGSAYLTGSGFLRQRGGDVVTCAGSGVWLAPATPFFSWVANQGNPAAEFGMTPMSDYVRTGFCDAEGEFFIESVPEGRYLVGTVIEWEIPGDTFDQIFGLTKQGGPVHVPVEIGSGEEYRVVITR